MHVAWLYTLISVIVVSLLSLIGIFFISIKANKLKDILIYMVSFSAGALMGDAFIHLLPEAVEKIGFGVQISLYILAGIGFFFILEKFIHWRHCHMPNEKGHVHHFAVMNLFGDLVHNFIDGLIIAASYLVSIPVGFATTIAVILHEIPQEIGDFGVLLHGGFSKRRAIFYNFITALAAIVGAVVGLLLGRVEHFILFLTPFAAGGFIYIAGADLIPELHKEVKVSKSLFQFLFFCLGIIVML